MPRGSPWLVNVTYHYFFNVTEVPPYVYTLIITVHWHLSQSITRNDKWTQYLTQIQHHGQFSHFNHKTRGGFVKSLHPIFFSHLFCLLSISPHHHCPLHHHFPPPSSILLTTTVLLRHRPHHRALHRQPRSICSIFSPSHRRRRHPLLPHTTSDSFRSQQPWQWQPSRQHRLLNLLCRSANNNVGERLMTGSETTEDHRSETGRWRLWCCCSWSMNDRKKKGLCTEGDGGARKRRKWIKINKSIKQHWNTHMVLYTCLIFLCIFIISENDIYTHALLVLFSCKRTVFFMFCSFKKNVLVKKTIVCLIFIYITYL